MIRALILTPAALSLLMLAAHFWRAGRSGIALFFLAAVGLLFSGKRWAVRTLQTLLAAGTLVWVCALWRLAGMRRAEGLPWIRLAFILGGVALFTALSALVFETRGMKRSRDRIPPQAGGSSF